MATKSQKLQYHRVADAMRLNGNRTSSSERMLGDAWAGGFIF